MAMLCYVVQYDELYRSNRAAESTSEFDLISHRCPRSVSMPRPFCVSCTNVSTNLYHILYTSFPSSSFPSLPFPFPRPPKSSHAYQLLSTTRHGARHRSPICTPSLLASFQYVCISSFTLSSPLLSLHFTLPTSSFPLRPTHAARLPFLLLLTSASNVWLNLRSGCEPFRWWKCSSKYSRACPCACPCFHFPIVRERAAAVWA